MNRTASGVCRFLGAGALGRVASGMAMHQWDQRRPANHHITGRHIVQIAGQAMELPRTLHVNTGMAGALHPSGPGVPRTRFFQVQQSRIHQHHHRSRSHL
jgi:hypothetical protein